MEDFDDDPLDLLDDDGDGVIEMSLFFDEEQKKEKGNGSRHNSGCCVVLLAVGASSIVFGYTFKFLVA